MCAIVSVGCSKLRVAKQELSARVFLSPTLRIALLTVKAKVQPANSSSFVTLQLLSRR